MHTHWAMTAKASMKNNTIRTCVIWNPPFFVSQFDLLLISCGRNFCGWKKFSSEAVRVFDRIRHVDDILLARTLSGIRTIGISGTTIRTA